MPCAAEIGVYSGRLPSGEWLTFSCALVTRSAYPYPQIDATDGTGFILDSSSKREGIDMLTTTLAGPVARYIAGANAQDVDAVTACFGSDAVVHDEGKSRQGMAAIRQWAEEVSEKYHPIVEVIQVAAKDDRTILSGRVSGNFPGSPVELRYVFTLDMGKISRLEIS
jgi:hypothetical protein